MIIERIGSFIGHGMSFFYKKNFMVGGAKMGFKERLSEKISESDLTHKEIAKKAGITVRALDNYESGKRWPKDMATAGRLANALNTTVEYLLPVPENYLVEACEKGGMKHVVKLKEVFDAAPGIIGDAPLDQEQLKSMYGLLNRAYWTCAEEARRKFTPKKYRK